MIETVGDLIEELQQHDPNLRLILRKDDSVPSTTDSYLLPDGIYQISADFVSIGVSWFEPRPSVYSAPAP